MERTARLESFHSLGDEGFHRIAYTDWGRPDASRVAVCVHGLTRNARDFDPLARILSADSRVVCMDVVGRGRSDWLASPVDYGFERYKADAAALLARLTAPRAASWRASVLGWASRITGGAPPAREPQVAWVGTSMGGLIGMMLAAKRNSPIRRLVLNDVGPAMSWRALGRLGERQPSPGAHAFDSLAEAEAHLRVACAPFGPLDAERWQEVILHGLRPLDDGRYALAYDPAIFDFGRLRLDRTPELAGSTLLGLDMWSTWDAIRCPTLVLRGKDSEILTPDTALAMQQRGPRARVVEFDSVGHAPWIASPDQIDVVREFLHAIDSPGGAAFDVAGGAVPDTRRDFGNMCSSTDG